MNTRHPSANTVIAHLFARFNFKLSARILLLAVVLVSNIGVQPDVVRAETGIVQIRVSQSSDDAEERLSNGVMDLTSTDLELIRDGTVDQIVGMRFQNVTVPAGATILNAYLEFETDETANLDPISLTLRGQSADNPGTFTSTAYNISSRTRTTASVAWSPATWTSLNVDHQTPDISSVVQEIVNRAGWSSGNAMAFIVQGSGRRVAKAYDLTPADPDGPPLLVIEYTTDSYARFREGVNGYTGTVDTYLESADATANNATATPLVVDLSPEQQILLRFDGIFGSNPGQIPAGATILSAELEINVTNESAQGASLHRMLQTWSDTNNWNTWSGGIDADGIEAAVIANSSSSGSSTGIATIDVTDDLQAWSNNPASNFGWAWLPPAADDSWQFDSSEGSLPPRLTVIYDYSTNPTIFITGTPLNPFSSTPGTPSAEQSYTVSGINLIEDLVVTAPADFEISTTSGSNFVSSLSLTPSGGSVPATPIYVRFNRTTQGSSSGVIAHTSNGAATQNVAVSGSAANTVTVTFQDGASSYTGTIDTFIRASNATTNYSADVVLEWDDNTTATDEITFLRFNNLFNSSGGPIPAGASIVSASLRYMTTDLTGTSTANGDPASVYESLVDWPETTVTWNNFGGEAGVQADEYQNLVTSAPADALSTAYTIDVTASLQRWSNNPSSNLGWVFLPTADDGVTLYSSEAATIANRPLLTVVYAAGGPVNQTPDLPTLVSPPDGATEVATSPTLEVTVSDPDGDALDVTFYGRAASSVTPGEDFTLIALPDTQNESQYYPAAFTAQTQWIANNKTAENIVFVTHLGDIVNTATSATQYNNADAAMDLLDAADAAYSVGPGNHDMGTGSLFETYFGVSRFTGKSWYAGHYGSDNYNNYSLFSASGLDFILINLQYNPTTAMLDWADALLKAYPERRGIVESHNQLNVDDSWSNQGIFTALQDNPNLFLLLAGHMHTPTDGAARRTETGSNGNTIYVLMSDYQDYPNGGNGYLRVMRFSPANNRISVETYSPYIPGSLTDAANQFDLVYDMTEEAAFEVIGTVNGVASGSNASVVWSGLNNLTDYEWYAVASDGALSRSGVVNSFRTRDIAYADPSVSCAGNTPCFATIQGAIDAVSTSGIVYIYSGTYNESITLAKNASVTLDPGASVTLNGTFSQSQGSFSAADSTFAVRGNFNYSGATFNSSGSTILFDSGASQNLTLNAPLAFHNLTVGSGTTLVETTSTDNATVGGTLTNNGTIRKSQAVSGAGALTFGLTAVQMNVQTPATLSNLTVDRIDQNHPAAITTNMRTGRYWSITATGNGYSVDLTLPQNNLSNPQVCKYLGVGSPGAGYDCLTSSSTSSSVVRQNVTSFSEWTVGHDVSPTAVELTGFTARTGTPGGILLALAAILLTSGWLLFRRAQRRRPAG